MFSGNETAEQIRERRADVKKKYGRFFDQVSEILFRNDPIGINFEDNTDEYEPEVETILPRLRNCNSSEEVLVVVHAEFQKWFNGEVGSREDYSQISEEIWEAWLRSGLNSN